MANKNVIVGNKQTSSYDPISQEPILGVTQDGAAAYTAKVSVVDIINQTSDEYPLVLGEVSTVDMLPNNIVTLECVPLQGYKFSQASYNGTNITFTDQEVYYTFTSAQKTDNDINPALMSHLVALSRRFFIETIEDVPETWYTLEIEPNLEGKLSAKLVDENGDFVKDLPIGEPFNMTSQDHYTGSFIGRGYSIILTPVGGAEITGTSSNWSFDPIKQTGYSFSPMSGATNGEWIKRGLNADYERSGNYTIEVELLAEMPDTVAPFNRLYLVDTETMRELTNIDLHLPDEEINRTDFMINLLQVPFELPNEVIGAESGIVIGDLETVVTAPILLSDVINIPLGEIEIESGESSLDYSIENQYELILPFIESVITLNPNQVLDNTIRVEYSLDGYNGDLTVNLFSGESETPFITNKAATGREIPIKLRSEYALATGRMLGVDNGTLKAYIRAIKPELTTGQYNNLVEVFSNLSEVKGYIEVSKIDLRSGRATLSDKESIIGLLSSGVIINE